ncbi:MAG: hypothetical protein ACKVU4_15465 [Phycisphaerales bacterium]
MPRSWFSKTGQTPRRIASASGHAARFEGCEQLEPRLTFSTVHWDGGGDGVTLTDKHNWECDVLPDKYDHAIIDVAANPLIQHNAGTFKVKQFTLAEDLTITGGTVSVSSLTTVKSGGGVMNLAAGLFDGNGLLSVSGKLKWTGGKLSGGGDVEVKSTGTFVIAGSGTLELRRDIKSYGSITWASGDIDGYDACGTEIVNKAGALFKATGSTSFRSFCWPGAFINEGTTVRDGEGLVRLVVPTTNSGTLNVVSGTLQLLAGGSNSGTRHVAAEGVLHYFGDFTHAAGSTLTGGGITIWQGGKHTIGGDWTMSSFLHVTNATVKGSGTLSIDGPLTWNSGRFEGDGGTVINPTGKISLMTLGEHTLARDISNNGTLIWNRGGLTFEGATITNNADKFFYVQANATAVGVEGAGDNRIINHGEIRKQLPTDLGFGGVILDNLGHLNVRNGSLTLNQGAVAQITGTTLTDGSWSVFGTALFSLSGAMIETVGAGAAISWIGRYSTFEGLGGLTLNEGAMTLGGGVPLVVTPAGGTFTNAGTMTFKQGTPITVAGDFVQTATGAIVIDISAHGLLSTGRLISAQNASLAGGVSFTYSGGFLPLSGDRFYFLKAAATTGTFGTIIFPDGPGPVGTLEYSLDGVRLVFA